jgi:hypothetical protein
MIKIITLSLLILLISGCEKKIIEEPKPILTESILRDIFLKAMQGEREYNDSLSGLIDYSLPMNTNFNELKISKIVSPLNKTFFALTAEFPNPVYNRFAVYDSALHLILLDKSLTGKISLKTLNISNKQFIEVSESFLSKDIFQLNRMSLYGIDSTVRLNFRTFTKFSTPKNQYYQLVTEITQESIKTNITSTRRSFSGDKSETFSFNNDQRKYLSPKNIFNNLIKEQISNFKGVVQNSEITDMNSALQSVGITNMRSKSGYYLLTDEEWKEIRDIGLYGFADRLKGDKYYNPRMGANIFVTLLPAGDSAEVYVKTRLYNIRQGKYRVRYTDKVEQKKYYIQYFEYGCGTMKYLITFQASKFTYEKYKSTYQTIINSFVMECGEDKI